MSDYEKLTVLLAAIARRRRWGFVRRRLAVGGGGWREECDGCRGRLSEEPAGANVAFHGSIEGSV